MPFASLSSRLLSTCPFTTLFITDIPIMSMRIHDKVRDCWVILSKFMRACPLISSVTGIIFLLQLLVSISPVNWLLCPQSKSVTICTRCVFFFHRHLWHFQDVEVAWLGMVATFPLGSPLGCKFSIFVRGIVSSCGNTDFKSIWFSLYSRESPRDGFDTTFGTEARYA